MTTEWTSKEWTKATELLLKFCPFLKGYVSDPQSLSMDLVASAISRRHPGTSRKEIGVFDSSRSVFVRILEETIDQENGRALVFPDLGSVHDHPFICQTNRLLQRIDEGRKSDTGRNIEFIDGCSDILVAFEKSGRLLLIDHEDGYTLT